MKIVDVLVCLFSDYAQRNTDVTFLVCALVFMHGNAHAKMHGGNCILGKPATQLNIMDNVPCGQTQ